MSPTAQLLEYSITDIFNVIHNRPYHEYIIDTCIREMALQAVEAGRDFLTHTLKYKCEPCRELSETCCTISLSAWCE